MNRCFFSLFFSFSMVSFSSDLDIQTRHTCLSGQPTDEMVTDGTYRAVMKQYSGPQQMLWGDPEGEATLELLHDEIQGLGPFADLGIDSLGATVVAAVGDVEKLGQDQLRAEFFCLSLEGSQAALQKLREQRYLLLAVIAGQQAFANHLHGLEFQLGGQAEG